MTMLTLSSRKYDLRRSYWINTEVPHSWYIATESNLIDCSCSQPELKDHTPNNIRRHYGISEAFMTSVLSTLTSSRAEVQTQTS